MVGKIILPCVIWKSRPSPEPRWHASPEEEFQARERDIELSTALGAACDGLGVWVGRAAHIPLSSRVERSRPESLKARAIDAAEGVSPLSMIAI